MNDLFLFSPKEVPREGLELQMKQGVRSDDDSVSLHSYADGFQVRHRDGILLDLNALDPSEVYLDDAEKARFRSYYCLSYHPADIDSVLAIIAGAIHAYCFTVAADAEGYTPRFLPEQLPQLAQYVRESEMRD